MSTGTVYRSDSTPGIQREIDRAQAVLDSHASGLNGLCVTCRIPHPCAHREPAVAVFFRYFRVCLPQRTQRGGPEADLTPVDWFASHA